MTVCEIKNLRKKFRGGRGVDDISLRIEEGDVFGLLGANGAGKTTTMKVVTGLMRKDAGEVSLFGEALETSFERVMRRVGALIETPAFYGYMSAKANLMTAAAYYGKPDPAACDGLLHLVRLYEYRNDKAGRFSLGMKQRLGLALAFVGDPAFCVLDEPSNGLDIEGIIEIRNIILGMSRERRVTFLVSSHQSAEIQKLCNKVAVIHEGRVDGAATTRWVLENFPSMEDYYLYCVRGGQPVAYNDGVGAY
ncbi:MAG: ABC transporter ATP-binding protein [Clostridiales bacterium]|jgi:ABC-2 type transport system ATP-binding protein|nr:ABC transporter ATP-binding protein [Clostridiales bacterium]